MTKKITALLLITVIIISSSKENKSQIIQSVNLSGEELNFNLTSDNSGLTLPFIEDWETNSGILINNGFIYEGADYTWTFETNLPNKGRASWGTSAFRKHAGNGAITLDKDFPTSSYSINSAILTLDLSNYNTSAGLELSFWWTDHGDEENVNDKVWIRGSNTDAWVQAYDLNPAQSTNNVFRFVGPIDIDNLLASASPAQVVSSTFQVRFGQQDNGPIPSDGITFDDISINETVNPPFQTFVPMNNTNDIKVELFNFPNPFNGTTMIQLKLEKTSFSKLTVFNSLGNEIAILYDGVAEANQIYRLEFNGLNLAPGIYFYHLQTSDGLNKVKKMQLIK
jgi:hypothetical protein